MILHRLVYHCVHNHLSSCNCVYINLLVGAAVGASVGLVIAIVGTVAAIIIAMIVYTK